ncbi:MAG: hypothetical protein GFH27_549281n431 [Chloroflexi bacterium AL-W]|nr:hypothetical protein [Chloroflexi bacterium AL-N1]NOK70924.1 hypothetical protein [Chloroflexi bacterium AL-N10]NOK73197.1 hypothetical protein [Chloroflexi bacterium AL-N5]NOK80094.1 hypothetical protein [Chloroflexi bacterium AL-W]NOK88051.1 hypothetical protein [Chloroflexi bacterium AL-N15]
MVALPLQRPLSHCFNVPLLSIGYLQGWTAAPAPSVRLRQAQAAERRPGNPHGIAEAGGIGKLVRGLRGTVEISSP